MQRLKRHPESQGGLGLRVEAQTLRTRSELQLLYRVQGVISEIEIPPATASERADELWLHTCFEVFARTPDGGYAEFNFAPSTRWAAYRFGAYRSGMAPADVAPPRIQPAVRQDDYELSVELDLAGGLAMPPAEPWRLALSAVIEDRQGRRSYWALAHPPGKPDFHHPDSFVLDLPPPNTPPDTYPDPA